MALGWINVEEFSFNHLLMLERFQIRWLCSIEFPEIQKSLGIALRHHPSVAWYLAHRCPECATHIEQLVKRAPEHVTAEEIRKCECEVMRSIEDFILYTEPEQMDSCCSFIYGWDPSRLLELADFTDKIVLDVGSGSGRLAFAAAKVAREVYASEPVDRLREYLRDTIKQRGTRNVSVVDGMMDCLPYPDNTFDIVISGHVCGDDFEHEVAEITRVVKDGGWLIDCPGEDPIRPSEKLRKNGWEEFPYESRFGGTVYRYRKQVIK